MNELFIDIKDKQLFGIENSRKKIVDGLVDYFLLIKKLGKNQKDVIDYANKEGITDIILIKELYETALFNYIKNFVDDDFNKIVSCYEQQITFTTRSSNSIHLQQYSTPLPLAWLAGKYVTNNLDLGSIKRGCRFTKNHKENIKKYYPIYFEPSAGNGFLTIALGNENNIIVNEVDKNRRENLELFHHYKKVMNQDGSKSFHTPKMYDGIITNPPFGTIRAEEHGSEKKFKLEKLEHIMASVALETMKDDGRAAIIIGGHTKWDEYGRVQAGSNRIFLSYLNYYYYVDNVFNINGKLYAKQGTSYPIRLILINGRKSKPNGTAPLYNDSDDITINEWEVLFKKMFHKKDNESNRLASLETEMRVAIAEMEKSKSQDLGKIIEDETIKTIKNYFEKSEGIAIPKPIETLKRFKEVFKYPIITPINEIKVKDSVYNKILIRKRNELSGTIKPTLENPDFILKDIDGSYLFVKLFRKNSEKTCNVLAINKKDIKESYISSIHVKRNNTIINKIRKGAKLLLFSSENLGDWDIIPRNNLTPFLSCKDTTKKNESQDLGKIIDYNDFKEAIEPFIKRDRLEPITSPEEIKKGDNIVFLQTIWDEEKHKNPIGIRTEFGLVMGRKGSKTTTIKRPYLPIGKQIRNVTDKVMFQNGHVYKRL